MPDAKTLRLLKHLRRRAAAAARADLLAERQRRGFAETAARFAGVIQLAKAARVAGLTSFEQYVSNAGRMAEHIHEGRWMDGAYDTELGPHLAALQAPKTIVDSASQGAELDPASPADEAASKAYDAILDQRLGEVFLEFDLHDIAEIWTRDPADYRRIADIGWRRNRERISADTAITALVAVYEAEADRCEDAGAYYAACAMLGAAAEARLLLRALADPTATEAARLRIGKGAPRRGDPNGWTFDQLVAVASEAQWIGRIEDDDGEYDYIVSGLLQELRAMRNYVHAGRHGLEKPLEVLTLAEVTNARVAYDSLVISLVQSDRPTPAQPPAT